jgi:hypothetical protein
VGMVTADALTSMSATTSLKGLKKRSEKLKKTIKMYLSESQVCGSCGVEWGCGGSSEAETAKAISATPGLW